MTGDENLVEVINQSLGEVFKQSNQMRKNIFQAAEITITFPLKGPHIQLF